MTQALSDAGGPVPLLELRGITKRFGGTTALNDVSFTLLAGEIHALLGENGAGKSTLIKVLGGIHHPEAGEIFINGRHAEVHSVADADQYGIRLIHQELSLAPNLTVAQNIFLGRERHRFGFLSNGWMNAEAEALIERLGLDEIRDVTATVGDLSVAHRQLVEIARALSLDARILVLDEPTSSLSEAETEALFTTLRRLRANSVGMIYISHRLEEIIRLADRITVFRDGKSVGTQLTEAVNHAQLVAWVVGRDMGEMFHRPRRDPGEVALEVRDLRGESINGVSFELRKGEVLGIAGLVGAGRSELVRAIFGIDRLEGGEVIVGGKHIDIRCPGDALRAGVVLIPEDRQRDGLVVGGSVAFNIALPWLKDWISPGRPNMTKRRAIVERAVRDFHIKLSDAEQSIDSLSGGNQQKTLVGRWMEHRPDVLLLDEPTRGIDVGARGEIFEIIGGLVETGMAVLLISSDLDEVLNFSHRILVYRDGRVIDEIDAETTTAEGVMEQLMGAGATR